MPKGIYIRTAECNRKHSIAHKNSLLSVERCRKLGEACKGLKASKETRRKMSKSHLGILRPEIGEILKGKVKPIGHGLLTSLACRGISKSLSHKVALSQSQKRLWQDSTFRDQSIRRLIISWHTRPTRPELAVYKLLEFAYPGEYKYTGDGGHIIGGLCPDFSNINGQKKVIELFGDYWHKGQNPQDKIDRYAGYGFDCLVVWEKELKNYDNVIAKIREFHNRSYTNNSERRCITTAEQQLSMFDYFLKGGETR